MGYTWEITLVTEADKKLLKHLIDVQLLIKASSQREINTILESFILFDFNSIFNLNSSNVYVFSLPCKMPGQGREVPDSKAGSMAGQK